MRSTALISAAVSGALALPVAVKAVEISVSGHVNRALISVDGGDNDGDHQHVDTNSSRTRFRFTGSEELDSGLTVGAQFEYGPATNVRHGNAYVSSASGELTIRHGSRATDGKAHADPGGASWLVGATNWCSYASYGPTCPRNDDGRGSKLNYDTPAIGPASIAVSIAAADYWDAKVSVARSMGDASHNVRIGHLGENGGGGEVTSTSAGVAFEGTSVAVAWGEDNGSLIGHALHGLRPCCCGPFPWWPPGCKPCPNPNPKPDGLLTPRSFIEEIHFDVDAYYTPGKGGLGFQQHDLGGVAISTYGQ